MTDAMKGITDPLDALWARGRAYVRFGLENPEHYRIMFMTRPIPDAPPVALDQLPCLTAFTSLIEEVARCMDAGAIAAGDPFLVATNLWTAVHGITSLLIARPDFPWPDLDHLMSLVVDVQTRGLQAPAS
jgi:AcrR family transcriptional regulator